MAGMIPQERIQRAVEDVVDMLVELTKEIPLSCVPKRIVEQMVDSPSPLIVMETIEVARSILQERIQMTHCGGDRRISCTLSGPERKTFRKNACLSGLWSRSVVRWRWCKRPLTTAVTTAKGRFGRPSSGWNRSWLGSKSSVRES